MFLSIGGLARYAARMENTGPYAASFVMQHDMTVERVLGGAGRYFPLAKPLHVQAGDLVHSWFNTETGEGFCEVVDSESYGEVHQDVAPPR